MLSLFLSDCPPHSDVSISNIRDRAVSSARTVQAYWLVLTAWGSYPAVAWLVLARLSMWIFWMLLLSYLYSLFIHLFIACTTFSYHVSYIPFLNMYLLATVDMSQRSHRHYTVNAVECTLVGNPISEHTYGKLEREVHRFIFKFNSIRNIYLWKCDINIANRH